MLRWSPLLLVIACSTSIAGPARVKPSSVRQVWVDGSAVEAGDGSVQKPFRSLAAALGGGPVLVQIATGLYSDGPYSLAEGQTLQGKGQVVLAGPVTLSRGAALRGLAVQGGEIGVEVSGEVKLDAVSLSGQTRAAVRVKDGTLTLEGCSLGATISKADGLLVTEKGAAVIRATTFKGPFGKGVFFDSGRTLSIERSTFDGPVIGVHARGGHLTVKRSQLGGGRGPAILAGSTKVLVEDTQVTGHEHALLTRESDVRVRKFVSTRADRAGISLVMGSAHLEDIEVSESGSFGAIHSISADVRLERFVLRKASAYALNIREGHFRAISGEVRGVADDGGTGDGVHARQAKVDVRNVVLSDLAGVGVFAAEGADVWLQDVKVERAKWAGVVAETLGTVRAKKLSTLECPTAIAVPGEGTVEAEQVVATGVAETAIWAECLLGAKVKVKGLTAPPVTVRTSACVEVR